MIGTLINERYRIENLLGEGGMGVVYKAHDTLLDRPVAIKTLSPALLGPDGLKRLQREAQAAAKLSHPNIVAVHDVVDDGDARLIVMEFVPGRTLRDLIPLPWTQAVEIAGQVCQALEYAHAHGIVHRDIKPENIIITDTGIAKVMDFGLARSEGRSRLTQTGMIAGTVAYMAPEQALGGQVDNRSDLYSLGAVLYETITGKPPFTADDPISVISMHVNVPPVSPRFHKSEIPQVLDSVIIRLLSKDPTGRYASAQEVERTLQLALTSSTEVADQAVLSAIQPSTSLFDMMTRGRLIDREEELAGLKGALEAMYSGRGQVVLIAGEPGIGKTRLAEELLIYARLRGSLAVIGHCYEQEVNIPYLPVAEALRGAVRAIPKERLGNLIGLQAPEIIKLVPELAHQIPGLTPSPPLEPEQERLRLYEAVSSLVAGLSQSKPVVLMLDDLHWADAATLALLRHLARGLRATRVLVLGTYRDVEVDTDHPLAAALSEMNRERLYKRILIRGLTAEHVAEMIHTILQTQNPVSEEFRDLIYRETEGNPFFVEEVLKHLVETGGLYLENGRWQRKPIQEIDIPQSMREVIGRRLKRISEPCQRVLSLAAVIGRRFRFEVLQAVGEFREDELLDALEEALRAQLIRERGEGGEVDYDFVHATIREVLYERLSLRRRMTLHQKVGETLERVHASRLEAVVEDLAHHFTRAPHGTAMEKAIQYSLDAGRKSIGLFAHEDAVRYHQVALDLLAELEDELRLAQTYVALGEPYVYLADTPAAVAVYERALKIYERRGNPEDIARVHRLIGGALQRNSEFSAAIPHLERALQGLSAETHPIDVIQTHLDLARATAFLGRVEESGAHAAQALHLAQSHKDVPLQAAAHVALGLAAHRRDVSGIEVGMSHYEEAVRLARDSQDPDAYYTLGRALNNISVLLVERGDFQGALQYVIEALAVARSARDVDQISFFNLQVSLTQFSLGDWQAAKRYAEENLRLPLQRRRRRVTEHRLHWIQGDWEAAAETARELLNVYRAEGEPQGSFIFAAVLAWHAIALGRFEDARVAAEYAAEILENAAEYHLWSPFPYVLEALARGGAYDRCEALCARAHAFSLASNSQFGLSHVLFGRGVLALERGDSDAAVRLIEESLSLTGLPVMRVHRLRVLSEALARRGRDGDTKHAREALREGLELAEKIGDGRTAEELRVELAALRLLPESASLPPAGE